MAMNILNNKRSLQRMALERPLDEIAIFLTSYCNLACRMCSLWKKREHGVNHDSVHLSSYGQDLAAQWMALKLQPTLMEKIGQ